jgi:hypothetical protein
MCEIEPRKYHPPQHSATSDQTPSSVLGERVTVCITRDQIRLYKMTIIQTRNLQ